LTRFIPFSWNENYKIPKPPENEKHKNNLKCAHNKIGKRDAGCLRL